MGKTWRVGPLDIALAGGRPPGLVDLELRLIDIAAKFFTQQPAAASIINASRFPMVGKTGLANEV
jgi:hypothetical protein